MNEIVCFFGGETHRNTFGSREGEQFLSHLASQGKVEGFHPAAARECLVFLGRDYLKAEINSFGSEPLRQGAFGCPRAGTVTRHHVFQSGVHMAIKKVIMPASKAAEYHYPGGESQEEKSTN